jgi:hypothetical protein
MKLRFIAILLLVLLIMSVTACSKSTVNRRTNVLSTPTEYVSKEPEEIDLLPVPLDTDKLVVELLDDLVEPVSNDEQDDYDAAYDLLKSSEFKKSLKLFKTFILKYPDSFLSDDAQNMIGTCYRDSKQYEDALNAYAHVILKYPNSSSIARAYYNIAYTYKYCLNKPDKAINYYVGCLRNVRSADKLILGHSYEELKMDSDIDVKLGSDVDPDIIKYWN